MDKAGKATHPREFAAFLGTYVAAGLLTHLAMRGASFDAFSILAYGFAWPVALAFGLAAWFVKAVLWSIVLALLAVAWFARANARSLALGALAIAFLMVIGLTG